MIASCKKYVWIKIIHIAIFRNVAVLACQLITDKGKIDFRAILNFGTLYGLEVFALMPAVQSTFGKKFRFLFLEM